MMVELDLRISDKLASVLPPLSAEEKESLEKNLKDDARVIDPILYWNDGTENIVLDGMNRLPFAQKHGIPYHTEPMPTITSYEQAELWILDHALGQRNITDANALRQIRGDLYNRLKTGKGGNRKGGNGSKCHDVTLIGDAAEQVAKKSGVTKRTVKRDGVRMAAVDTCAESFAKGIRNNAFKATDEQIQLVSTLPTESQEEIAREARFGKPMTQAIEKVTGKPAKKPTKKLQKSVEIKPDYGKCPCCAGLKWKMADDGVFCSKCNHPHGEPVGDISDESLRTQRSKTIKTVEALMRAFDDLQCIKARKVHEVTIETCKALLKTAREWK